jgi:serine protease inhibitor
MNRKSTFPALAGLLAIVAAAGCKDPAGPTVDGPWHAVRLDDEFVHGYTGFGFELFRALLAEAPSSNLFISPTSAAFALAMTYNGAVGETQRAMARVLGVDGLSRDQVNRNNLRWFESLVNSGRSVELSLANSLWIRQGFPVGPSFLDRNREFYRADVQELDFGDPAAPGIINAWVAQSTRGKIPEIVDQIPVNVVMYLINALYFQGDWSHPFDRRLTRDEPFTLPDGSRKTVPMMVQDRSFRLLRGDGFSALELPYGNGRFAMVLALPDQGSTLHDFYARLEPGRWEQWMDAFQEQRVMVSLPRFQLEWESSLNEALIGMGMGVAFAAGPVPHDFTAMSPANPWIDEVKQKTHLEVDEEGTTAAAVTSVAMVTSMPPEMRFDRPFFLAIYDHATRTVLFLGQVAEPN